MASQEALSSHLTVPLEMMCEPQKFAPGTSPDEGITEEMDRILADRLGKNKVQTWEEMCRLLFGPDSAIPEPGEPRRRERILGWDGLTDTLMQSSCPS